QPWQQIRKWCNHSSQEEDQFRRGSKGEKSTKRSPTRLSANPASVEVDTKPEKALSEDKSSDR
ncbi:hypothetical protein A6R68_24116, partial [Neotoma lepida]